MARYEMHSHPMTCRASGSSRTEIAIAILPPAALFKAFFATRNTPRSTTDRQCLLNCIALQVSEPHAGVITDMNNHMGNFESFKCLKFIGLKGLITYILYYMFKKLRWVTLAPSSENVVYPYSWVPISYAFEFPNEKSFGSKRKSE